MQMVSGGNLEQYLEAQGGRLSEEQARPLFAQILEGLSYLHSQKVTHRHLSLKSLLITKNKVIKFTNFHDSKKLFNANRKLVSVVGHPDYMAPEITASVDDEENINDTPFEIAEGYDGFLADLFAAGIVLLKMVAG